MGTGTGAAALAAAPAAAPDAAPDAARAPGVVGVFGGRIVFLRGTPPARQHLVVERSAHAASGGCGEWTGAVCDGRSAKPLGRRSARSDNPSWGGGGMQKGCGGCRGGQEQDRDPK